MAIFRRILDHLQETQQLAAMMVVEVREAMEGVCALRAFGEYLNGSN